MILIINYTYNNYVEGKGTNAADIGQVYWISIIMVFYMLEKYYN